MLSTFFVEAAFALPAVAEAAMTVVIYAMVQAADMMKCVIGFILVKKGVWLQNIVS